MTEKAYRQNGLLHRIDGPAVILKDGSACWYSNGVKHRIKGPAVELADGSKYWYFNGVLHREDGPAIEYHDGTKYWYLHGKKHRLDGPAVERKSGRKQFWILGVRVSPELYADFVDELNNPSFQPTVDEQRKTKKVETLPVAIQQNENIKALDELNGLFNYIHEDDDEESEEDYDKKIAEIKKVYQKKVASFNPEEKTFMGVPIDENNKN